MNDLDREIALRVMGWTDGHSNGIHCFHTDDGRKYAWNPSTDMNDAMLVVERMRELGFVRFEGGWAYLHKCYVFTFEKVGERGDFISAKEADESPARAICLAALKAMEVT